MKNEYLNISFLSKLIATCSIDQGTRFSSFFFFRKDRKLLDKLHRVITLLRFVKNVKYQPEIDRRTLGAFRILFKQRIACQELFKKQRFYSTKNYSLFNFRTN